MKTINNKGFSLIQLIVGVSIILILSAVVLFGEDALSRKGTAQDVKRSQDVIALGKAVELYQNDNGALPADLQAAVMVGTDEKYVLCSLEASRTCDGQTRTCHVIDDTDFLGTYLKGSLPIDPEKANALDTGYYITRNGNQMVFGACDSYSGNDIEYVANAKIPPVCGNSIVEDGEACDNGASNICIGNSCCGNYSIQYGGNTYCNNTCTAEIYVSVTETCDYSPPFDEDCSVSGEEYDTGSTPAGMCNITCDSWRSPTQVCDGVGID